MLADHPAEHIQTFLKICLKTLEDSLINPVDTQLWEMFIGQIGQRDRIRGNDHRRFLRY
jgi:hypothetical protein